MKTIPKVTRLQPQFSIMDLRKQIDLLRFQVENLSQQQESLAIKTTNAVLFVPIHLIVYLEASSNYTKLILEGGKNVLISKTLKHVLKFLPSSFWRIHQSYAVNKYKISKIIGGNNRILECQSEVELPISKSYYSHIQQQLECC